MEKTRRDNTRRHWADDDAERGATLVEYALLVGLFGLAVVGGLRVLQDRANERYDETGAALTEVAGVVIEAPPEEDSDGGSDGGSDDAATPPAVSTSCGGSGSNCSFSIAGLPDGASVSWTVDGVASDSTLNGKKNSTYTVIGTITPGRQTATTVVTCSDAPVVCTAS
jgi:Flp pilus assembly pilin Flp